MAVVKAVESLACHGRILGSHHYILAALGGRARAGEAIAGLVQAGSRHSTTALAHGVCAEVGSYNAQPGVEPTISAKAGKSLPSSGESLLGDVFCVVDITHPAKAEPVKALVVAGIKLIEGLLVASLAVLDQTTIATDVHIVESRLIVLS